LRKRLLRVVEPETGSGLVGISSQGLFEFDDETVSWNAMGPGSAFINNRMGWIEYDPLVPERFWQAGSYGDGVFRTDDNGVTFSRLGDLRHLDFVSVDPQLSDGRLVTHSAESLLISADLGVSWTPFGPPLPYEPRGVAVSEDGEAVFVWRFSCNFGDGANPVEPFSILRLGADFEQS
jgi:hypothetical protein